MDDINKNLTGILDDALGIKQEDIPTPELDLEKAKPAATNLSSVLDDALGLKPEPTSVKPEQAVPTTDVDDFNLDTGKTLSKDDLKKGNNAKIIRNYMSDRWGKQYSSYSGKSDEEVVEDFVDHMRKFNTNTVRTAGEVRYISNANDAQKSLAADAYSVYDQLGNVFTNDGLLGAVDGVKDYMVAAATDPLNYIGLLTGGVARAGAFGGSAAAKKLVRQAATEAAKKAAKSGATRTAAKAAGDAAAKAATARLTKAGIKSGAHQEAIKKLAEMEQKAYMRTAVRGATKGVLDEALDKSLKKGVIAATGVDAFVAMANDYAIQSTMMEVGVQEEYSTTQTMFSSLLGGVGGGLTLAGGSFRGASGLGDIKVKGVSNVARAQQKEVIDGIILKETPMLGDEGAKKAAKQIKSDVLSWKQKWQTGRAAYLNTTTEADLLKHIVLGADGKGKNGGLVKVFNDQGKRLPKDMTVSDALTNVVKYLPQEELAEINGMLKGLHSTLGDMTQSRVTLGNLVASEANRGGQVLNVFSQAKKQIDVGVLRGGEVLEDAVSAIVEKETEKLRFARPLEYGQNFWRRMLVSSPQTTMANVSGFAQYNIGSTLADALTGTQYMVAAMASKGAKRTELLRKAAVYKNIQGQKMRNLMDPFTTHDAYLEFLSQNKDVSKVLFETVSGGVERTADRFGFDASNKWYQGAEAIAEGANKITGVRIQDTFTKSQMFMTELDKYLQLEKGVSLKQVINGGDTTLIDNNVIGSALDTTMKSVFSKDYTTQDQFLSTAAKTVENFSNIPMVGTILPFGRFFNNVVATAYQWSAGGAVELASALVKADKRVGDVAVMEAMSRSIVGLSAITLAMQYDDERQKQGLGTYEVDLGGGAIGDMQNVYPFSAFLAVGRYANIGRSGQPVPKEAKQELLNQLAIGQLAKDAQFGNDLINVFDFFFAGEESEGRAASLDALYKASGNIAAGVLRPLDAINRSVGFITGDDVAKDVRQASGASVFTQSATRYVDNIIEAFTTDIDAITGEELAVGARAGKIQDANPLAKMSGVNIKQSRTAAELAYNMAQLMPYTASMRSKNPAYDKAFNQILAPELEVIAENLLQDPKFKEGDIGVKRSMIQKRMKTMRTKITQYMKDAAPEEMRAEHARKQALTDGSPSARKYAMEQMRDMGYSGEGIGDMGLGELTNYMTFIKDYENYYQ